MAERKYQVLALCILGAWITEKSDYMRRWLILWNNEPALRDVIISTFFVCFLLAVVLVIVTREILPIVHFPSITLQTENKRNRAGAN